MNNGLQILDCYDRELNAVADLAGDFDAASAADREAWEIRQWREVARALGFAQQLDAAVAKLRGRTAGSIGLSEAGVQAFLHALSDQHAEHMPAYNLDRARVRHLCLTTLRSIGAETHSLFRLDTLSTRLPERACYRPEGSQTPTRPTGPSGITTPSASGGPVDRTVARLVLGGRPPTIETLLGLPAPGDDSLYRAFRSEVAPSYFADKHPTPASGSSYPVLLSLGTFPFVHGGLLGRHAPGLRWEAGRPWSPAALAMRTMVSLWEPTANLTQDARLVVRQYQHFRATTDVVLGDVPQWTGEGPHTIGALYRRDGLLHVHQGSAELARCTGPRGELTAFAYNYVLRRFASFFAARRAFLRSPSALPSEARAALAKNPDPCVRSLPRKAS